MLHSFVLCGVDRGIITEEDYQTPTLRLCFSNGKNDEGKTWE
jgi:hypothetical protein